MRQDKDRYKEKSERGDMSQTRGTFSKLDAATVSYFTEVGTHLKTVEDPEERFLLAENALEETKGKEAEIAMDATCSRVLEVLLAAGASEAVQSYAHAVLGERFLDVAANPFGSHVAEKLLHELAELVQESGLGTEHPAYKVLQSASAVLAGDLYNFITNRFASYVARRILVIAAGRDVTPAQASPASGRDEALRSSMEATAQSKGLAAKVILNASEEAAVPLALPGLLEPIADAILGKELASNLVNVFPYDSYSSPFLQAYLLAQKDNRDHLNVILLRFFGLNKIEDFATLSVRDMHSVLEDRTSSHFMEVVMKVAPPELRAAIYEHFLRGHLQSLAMHPVANFTVQAALAAVTKTSEMKAVIKELRSAFPALLRSKRGGVVAAALAAAARTGAGQPQLADALAAAVRELPGNTQGLGAALLTLDISAKLDGITPGRRLSTLGCTMLSTVLAYEEEVSRVYAESLMHLSPGELTRVGGDASGSRVLEAFLGGSASAKAKKKLFRKLHGSYAAIASTSGGSFLVEKCYLFAGMKEKEVIAEELAQAEPRLATFDRGAKLLRRCGVAEFKRNSDRWRNRTQAAANLQQDFADILGDEPSAPRVPGEPGVPEANKAQGKSKSTVELKKKKKKSLETAKPAQQETEAKAPVRKRKAIKQTVGEQTEDFIASLLLGAEQPALKRQRKRSKEMSTGLGTEVPVAAEEAVANSIAKEGEAEDSEQQAAASQEVQIPNGSQSAVTDKEADEEGDIRFRQAEGGHKKNAEVRKKAVAAAADVVASGKVYEEQNSFLQSAQMTGVIPSLEVFVDRARTSAQGKKAQKSRREAIRQAKKQQRMAEKSERKLKLKAKKQSNMVVKQERKPKQKA